MIVYKTPSTVAFHRRQQFHAAQKNPSETISDWFMRLQLFIDKCEFESVCDYMLIEKFISGLSDEDFEKISQVPTWTTEDLVLVVIGNPQIFKNVSRENQLQVNINDILSLQVKCETVNLVSAFLSMGYYCGFYSFFKYEILYIPSKGTLQ